MQHHVPPTATSRSDMTTKQTNRSNPPKNQAASAVSIPSSSTSLPASSESKSVPPKVPSTVAGSPPEYQQQQLVSPNNSNRNNSFNLLLTPNINNREKPIEVVLPSVVPSSPPVKEEKNVQPNIAASSPRTQPPNNNDDSMLVIPILFVSSLPKEVDQLLRLFTSGKQLRKQSPPCVIPSTNDDGAALKEKHSKNVNNLAPLPTITTTSTNGVKQLAASPTTINHPVKSVTQGSVGKGTRLHPSNFPEDHDASSCESSSQDHNHSSTLGDMETSPGGTEAKPKPLLYNAYLSPRSTHSRTSSGGGSVNASLSSTFSDEEGHSFSNTQKNPSAHNSHQHSPSPQHHHQHSVSGSNKHHNSSTSRSKHHHKSTSGSVSFNIPSMSTTVITRAGSRKNIANSEDTMSGIQNIQQHIHQQLQLHEQEPAVPSLVQPHQPVAANKKSPPPKKLEKEAHQEKEENDNHNPNKLNFYLRKNKRVTEWYIEEWSPYDYMEHLGDFMEKNDVKQISAYANGLLNSSVNIEDILNIDEEEYFESYLEKITEEVKKQSPNTLEKHKIMFRICHTGSRHALSLRQVLYKQMLLDQTTGENNQIIAPTVVVFVYSYTNPTCSLENTIMNWMKEINQIYPSFSSQGNFMFAGHMELNKTTKQHVAVLRRNVEDITANTGLVQKTKHYYNFHQKAVPLFQNKRNQRLPFVEFDTRLGNNVSNIFAEAYRLYCLNQYRKKLMEGLLPPKQQVPSVFIPIPVSQDTTNEPQGTQSPSQPNLSIQAEDGSKKKKDAIPVTNEVMGNIIDEEHAKDEKVLPANVIQKMDISKTARSLGLLKIFKKTKKEDPINPIKKAQKKKKKKEDYIFRWHKIADNFIMTEKPKKKTKKEKVIYVKSDLSAADDNRNVITDSFFHNRKKNPLFPYNLHIFDDNFSPQIEKHNSNVLSKPIEDIENEYLEDPTENDMMGEMSESSSIADTFEHQFTNPTNTSSYQGEVIASDNDHDDDDEEADLDTENDIISEVDDFTFQSSVGSVTPHIANSNAIGLMHFADMMSPSPRDSNATQVWEELDGEEDFVDTSVNEMEPMPRKKP